MSRSIAWHMAGTERIFVELKCKARILPTKLCSLVKEKAYGWGMGNFFKVEWGKAGIC